MRRKPGQQPKPKPKSKPKLMRSAPSPIPENWSAEQARAVYDLCSALQELVWRRYRNVLLDPMLQAQLRGSNQTDTRTYPLAFDEDDAPF